MLKNRVGYAPEGWLTGYFNIGIEDTFYRLSLKQMMNPSWGGHAPGWMTYCTVNTFILKHVKPDDRAIFRDAK